MRLKEKEVVGSEDDGVRGEPGEKRGELESRGEPRAMVSDCARRSASLDFWRRAFLWARRASSFCRRDSMSSCLVRAGAPSRPSAWRDWRSASMRWVRRALSSSGLGLGI